MSWLRPLGNTGIQVSALGLGTVKLGRTSKRATLPSRSVSRSRKTPAWSSYDSL